MTGRERPHRVPAVLRGLVPPLAGVLAAIAVVLWLASQPGPDESGAPRGLDGTSASSPAAEPASKASEREVERLHQTLHSVARECQKPETIRSFLRIDRDVDIILRFAHRYPEGRFPIDDETGNALSLLFATRDDLRTCAPAAAARINQAMPLEFRDR